MITTYQLLRKLERMYDRVRLPLEKAVFPLTLLLWPLVKVNQGIDVSDSTYSLGNFLFIDNIQPVWKLSTYLSLETGSALLRLPYGNRLLAMNIYTGLIVSLIGLTAYFILKRDFSPPGVFLGEFMAISFCWIPSVILYNYLSYLLFTAGALLLYLALRSQSSRMYLAAGVLLGMNIWIRIPNVLQAMLIVAVWVCSKEKLKSTGWCMAGYMTGGGIPLVLILLKEGPDSITNMVRGLLAMSGSDSTYTPVEMIMSTLRAYGRSLKWVSIIGGIAIMGTLVFAAYRREGVIKWLKKAGYLAVVAVMLRFFWGRGMFSFRFYEDYTSMYEWGMIVLFLGLITAFTVILGERYNRLQKIFAWLTLESIIITPLGSNNYTLQNLNNLFLVLPFVVCICGGWLYRGSKSVRMRGFFQGCNFPWMSMLLVLLGIIFVQSGLFHINFVFRDGMRGEPRDSRIENIASLAGMYTTDINSRELSGLGAAIEELRKEDINNCSYGIFWGDCPGLSYILNMEPAIDSSWPDLDSYPVDYFRNQIMELSTGQKLGDTVIIVRNSDRDGDIYKEKEYILNDFMDARHFHEIYTGEEYTLYTMYMD